jgi:uncharacterized protein YjbI with pentapeptide repeats
MANHEHLIQLVKGVESWNKWKSVNQCIEIDLSLAFLNEADLSLANLNGANLSEAYFSGANLSGADLSEAYLSGAYLDRADLSGVNLNRAKLCGASLSLANLNRANLNRANLNRADFSGYKIIGGSLSRVYRSRADLSEADLSEADLSEANLSQANLSGADLNRADLNRAILSECNLIGADLMAAQLLGTNLSEANLTGACIQDWNINSSTNLEGVKCDFIYMNSELNNESQGLQFCDRRPHNLDEIFQPGDFQKLVQKPVSTVDLIFHDGIHWQAFEISFDKLIVEADGAEVAIQAIENKGDGSFVIRINTPTEFDKAEVEKFIKLEYDSALKTIEAKNQLLQLQEGQITELRQDKTNLTEIMRIMAARPVQVFTGDTYGVAASVEGDQKIHPKS